MKLFKRHYIIEADKWSRCYKKWIDAQ